MAGTFLLGILGNSYTVTSEIVLRLTLLKFLVSYIAKTLVLTLGLLWLAVSIPAST